FHGSFQDELSHDKAQQRDNDEEESEETHRRSSICATGFATRLNPKTPRANPITTSAIPHQRSVEINSPKKIQQPRGTKMSTTRDKGKATASGIYRSTERQLMKLAMMRRIAHQTRGEIRPLTPVQDHALSGSAMSVAPRFKRSSETNTQITLNVSCSHGLPKPEGRSCI